MTTPTLLNSFFYSLFFILRDCFFNPQSSYLIFKDSINFIIDFLKYYDDELFLNLIPFLAPIKYKKLPSPKYIPCNISNKNELRNSVFIQRDAELIVNLSNSIWETSSDDLTTYAQKSFDYVLNDIKYNLAPDQSAYGTLFYNSGVCYGKLNLYAALCRRRGIETRFKIIPFRLTQGFEDVFLSFIPDELEFFKPWIEKFINIKMPHHWLEILLDGEWYDGSPVQPAIFYKALNITPPGVDKERRKKSKVKKGYAKPIYMTEIYPFFNIASGLLGKIKVADLLNKKINDITREFEN
jgi:hypothetical protein